MDKKILIYLGDFEKKRTAITRVLDDLSIPYHIISDSELSCRVMDLMSDSNQGDIQSVADMHHTIDLMILKNISDEEIQQINMLLNALHTEMKHKAMLTKHNKDWTILSLLNEIEKEHQYFQDVGSIREILMQSKNLNKEAYSTSSWLAYEKAFYHAYECISKESTPEIVHDAYTCLLQAKEQLIHET